MRSRTILLAAFVTASLTVSGVFLLTAQTPTCDTYRDSVVCIVPCRDPFGNGSYFKHDNIGEPNRTTTAPQLTKDASSIGDRCADLVTGNGGCTTVTGKIGNDHVQACNPPSGSQ